ncbi:MAG: polysaccharide biosynthesis C-terminal domain-containing protein [Bacteroidota bacterium]
MGVVQRQGIKNTISSYAGILIGFISLLVIQPQLMKPEEIGLARVLFAFSTLISSFISLGVANMTIKYFPIFKNEKNGHHGFLGFVLLFPIVGFIFSSIGIIIFREFIIAQYRRESPMFIDYFNYIFPFSMFLAFGTVITTYLISLFKTTVPSYLSDVYTRLAYIALILAYYFQWLSLPQFIGGYVAVYAGQLLLLIIYLRSVDRPSLSINWDFLRSKNVKEMVSFGVLLSFTAIAVLGLKSLDAVLLGKFLPLSFVGIYAVASFIPTIIEAPYNALDRIVTAKVAHFIAEGKTESIKDVYYKSVKYLSVIAGLLFVGVNCNIESLLRLIGKDYSQGVQVVWIISVGSLINMMGGANNGIVLYSTKYWMAACISLVLVMLSFALNMILIPRLGLQGAAISTALSWGGYTLIRVYLVYRRYEFQPYGLATMKTLFIILLCIAVNFIIPDLQNDVMDIIMRSTVLGGSYLLMVYLLKIVPEFHHYLPWENK